MKSAEQSFFNRDSNVDIPTSSGFEKQNTENSPFVEKKFEYARYPKVMQTMQKFGLNVLSNQESTEEEKNFAKDYLEKLYYEYSSDTEGDIEDKDSWIKYVNEEISKRLTEKVFAFNENSPIYKQRKNLGILDKSQEKAFKIKVLSPESWDTLNYQEREDWWVKTTNCPSMFVSLYTKNDPVIFLSKDQADMLLSFNKEDSVDFNYGDKNNTSFSISELEKSRGGLWSLQHEYRHTQRNFTSNNNDLYRFIDEACTNVSSYNDLISVLTFLGYTTDDLSYSKIKEAYESDDENKIKDVLDIFQKNFGDIGVMLVGSQPSSYASSKDLVTAGGNGNLPILSSKEYSFIPQQCRFFEKLLELRKQKDSNWAKKITEKIGSEKISIQELENQRFAMHQFFIAAGFPNVSAFNKILEEEIKKRSSRS